MRVKVKVNDMLASGSIKPWPAVRDQLNRLLRGWSAYFCYGTLADAYKAVDHHVCERVRGSSTTSQGPNARYPPFLQYMVFGELGVLRLRGCTLARRRQPRDEASRKAGCGKSARPV